MVDQAARKHVSQITVVSFNLYLLYFEQRKSFVDKSNLIWMLYHEKWMKKADLDVYRLPLPIERCDVMQN